MCYAVYCLLFAEMSHVITFFDNNVEVSVAISTILSRQFLDQANFKIDSHKMKLLYTY